MNRDPLKYISVHSSMLVRTSKPLRLDSKSHRKLFGRSTKKSPSMQQRSRPRHLAQHTQTYVQHLNGCAEKVCPALKRCSMIGSSSWGLRFQDVSCPSFLRAAYLKQVISAVLVHPRHCLAKPPHELRAAFKSVWHRYVEPAFQFAPCGLDGIEVLARLGKICQQLDVFILECFDRFICPQALLVILHKEHLGSTAERKVQPKAESVFNQPCVYLRVHHHALRKYIYTQDASK